MKSLRRRKFEEEGKRLRLHLYMAEPLGTKLSRVLQKTKKIFTLGVESMLFNDIETERLFLKNISMDDRNFIFSQFSDDVVNRYLFDAEPLTEIDGADEIINFYIQPEPRLQHRWIIIRKSDGTKMGTCGFHCWNQREGKVDVGYDLKENFWGKGYMYEAMKEIITFAIDKMYIKEISACIYIDNQRSIRLVEKLGFVLSGSSYELFRDKKYLHHRYSLKIQ